MAFFSIFGQKRSIRDKKTENFRRVKLSKNEIFLKKKKYKDKPNSVYSIPINTKQHTENTNTDTQHTKHT